MPFASAPERTVTYRRRRVVVTRSNSMRLYLFFAMLLSNGVVMLTSCQVPLASRYCMRSLDGTCVPPPSSYQ